MTRATRFNRNLTIVIEIYKYSSGLQKVTQDHWSQVIMINHSIIKQLVFMYVKRNSNDYIGPLCSQNGTNGLIL